MEHRTFLNLNVVAAENGQHILGTLLRRFLLGTSGAGGHQSVIIPLRSGLERARTRAMACVSVFGVVLRNMQCGNKSTPVQNLIHIVFNRVSVGHEPHIQQGYEKHETDTWNWISAHTHLWEFSQVTDAWVVLEW